MRFLLFSYLKVTSFRENHPEEAEFMIRIKLLANTHRVLWISSVFILAHRDTPDVHCHGPLKTFGYEDSLNGVMLV